MKKLRLILFFTIMCASIDSWATLVIVNNSCNVAQTCDVSGKCTTACLFKGLNAAGDIVTLPLIKEAEIVDAGVVVADREKTIIFEKKLKQTVITYQPTVGRLQGKSLTLLFQTIDLLDKNYIATLPRKMRLDIEKYTYNNPKIRYAFFIFKSMRKNIWMEISQSYVDASSSDKTKLPLVLHPDGNINIIIPKVPNVQSEENFYIKIEQIS